MRTNTEPTTTIPAYVHSVFDGADVPLETKWSNPRPAPPIGARIKITMNGLGTGRVVAYQVIDSWLAVHVKLENPPEWWLKQHGNDPDAVAIIFGAEMGTPDPAPAPKSDKLTPEQDAKRKAYLMIMYCTDSIRQYTPKAHYALAYRDWLISGKQGDSPSDAGVSAAAALEVRIRLNDINDNQ